MRRKPPKPQPNKNIHYHTTIYAKSKKKRSQTLGSGKPADLDDREGTRKVPQGYNLATDRVPDFLKQKKTK
jgi:hypothetical protein